MKLGEIAKGGVVVLNANDTLNTAIQQMWRLSFRHLPVVRGNVPIGMVSERDVLLHVCWLESAGSPTQLRAGALSGASRVEQVMTTPVVVLSPDDSVEKAARLMLHKKFSAIPLASSGALQGIVTETDLLRIFAEDQWTVRGADSSIVDYMSTRVISACPDDATLDLIKLMRENQVRHVPVTRDERLVGIVSDRDVLRGGPRVEDKLPASVTELRVASHLRVDGIMSRDVKVLDPSNTLRDAARLMVRHKIGASVVVRDESVVGIITETDILRALLATGE